jgi:hypothetical protein
MYFRVDTKNLCQIGGLIKRHFALQQQTIMRGIKVRGNVQSYCVQNFVNIHFIYLDQPRGLVVRASGY